MSIRRDETLSQIAAAERIIVLIEALQPEDRKCLAILLITKARQG